MAPALGEIWGGQQVLWLGVPIKLGQDGSQIQAVCKRLRWDPSLFTKFPALQEQHINEVLCKLHCKEGRASLIHPCTCETWAEAVNGPREAHKMAAYMAPTPTLGSAGSKSPYRL